MNSFNTLNKGLNAPPPPIVSVYYNASRCYGICIDASLNLYCSEPANTPSLFKISSDKTVTTLTSIPSHSNCMDSTSTIMYIVSNGNTIAKFNVRTLTQVTPSSSIAVFGIDIAVDLSGHVFIGVADGKGLRCYKNGTTLVTLISGSGTGTTKYSQITDNVTNVNTLVPTQYYGVTINNGILYAVSTAGTADENNFIISMKLSDIYASDVFTGINNGKLIPVSKFAGNGLNTPALTAPIPSGTLATSISIVAKDIQFDGKGNAYIFAGSMIKKVNLATNFITLFAHSNASFAPRVTTSVLSDITSAAIDTTNRIMYIANFGGLNIIKITNI
jgi:hypothetical protein